MGGKTKAEKRHEAAVEAGARGGRRTAATRGPDFYREIGRKGGMARRDQLGPDGFAALGRAGGSERAARAGHDGMGALARKGHQRTRALIAAGKAVLGAGKDGVEWLLVWARPESDGTWRAGVEGVAASEAIEATRSAAIRAAVTRALFAQEEAAARDAGA
jgi:general stress protein YciG